MAKNALREGLAAVPAADSMFVKWVVNGEQVAGVVPVTGPITVTAVFEKK